MEDMLTLDDYYHYWNTLGLTMDQVNDIINSDRTFTLDEDF